MESEHERAAYSVVDTKLLREHLYIHGSVVPEFPNQCRRYKASTRAFIPPELVTSGESIRDRRRYKASTRAFIPASWGLSGPASPVVDTKLLREHLYPTRNRVE